MDITFSCTKCGQHIAVDEEGAGLIVNCPKCGTPLEVPDKSKVPTVVPQAPSAPPPVRRGQKKLPVAVRLRVVAIVVACVTLATAIILVAGKSPPPVTVEVFVRSKGGDTIRLSGAKVEVAEIAPPPSPLTDDDLRVLKPVKGFEGIVTDSEGKAVIRGLKAKYFIVVSESRQVGDSHENYLWVVGVNDVREGRLLIGDHNLYTDQTSKLLLLSPLAERAGSTAGFTPLGRAALNGYKEVVEMLLAKGAEVNAKDLFGNSPLQLAAIDGNKEVVEMLLARGADVNAKDQFGITPLHLVAYHGYTKVAEVLLAKGADVNAKNQCGSTPLHEAALKGHTDMVEVLRQHGGQD